MNRKARVSISWFTRSFVIACDLLKRASLNSELSTWQGEKETSFAFYSKGQFQPSEITYTLYWNMEHRTDLLRLDVSWFPRNFVPTSHYKGGGVNAASCSRHILFLYITIIIVIVV